MSVRACLCYLPLARDIRCNRLSVLLCDLVLQRIDEMEKREGNVVGGGGPGSTKEMQEKMRKKNIYSVKKAKQNRNKKYVETR